MILILFCLIVFELPSKIAFRVFATCCSAFSPCVHGSRLFASISMSQGPTIRLRFVWVIYNYMNICRLAHVVPMVSSSNTLFHQCSWWPLLPVSSKFTGAHITMFARHDKLLPLRSLVHLFWFFEEFLVFVWYTVSSS